MKKCDDCKQYKKSVRIRYCPYQEEVEDERVKVKICDECYAERLADI